VRGHGPTGPRKARPDDRLRRNSTILSSNHACQISAFEHADFIAGEVALGQKSEIDEIRALLRSKPRPVGWSERRQRLDEVGSVWPVADDVTLEAVDCDGVPGEWSLAPGSDASRLLIYFHGGGYCSGSILSHRRMVTEAGRATPHAHAGDRLPASA
jgi:acetyl esterase/lipase